MELLQVSLQVPALTQLQHSRKRGVVDLWVQAHHSMSGSGSVVGTCQHSTTCTTAACDLTGPTPTLQWSRILLSTAATGTATVTRVYLKNVCE